MYQYLIHTQFAFYLSGNDFRSIKIIFLFFVIFRIVAGKNGQTAPLKTVGTAPLRKVVKSLVIGKGMTMILFS
jgi:hypothetical protein